MVDPTVKANVKLRVAGLHPDTEQQLSDESKKLVRMDFNPSQREDVAKIKALSAALISACQDVASTNPAAKRDADEAIREAELASMWGVKAATTGL